MQKTTWVLLGHKTALEAKTDTEEAKIWTHNEHSQLRWSLAPCTDGAWVLMGSSTFQELQSWKEDLQGTPN